MYLIHMHKLETRYLFYGSKVNLGSFGVIGVKFWFSLKMHYLFYVTKYIHVIHTLASHLRNKQGNWGQSGVDVLKPAGYAVCDGNMSSSFFFFLSFWQHVFFTYFPTFDFDQTWSQWPVCWPLLRHKQWWGQKGHFHHKGIKSFRIRSIYAWLTHMH